MFAVDWMRENLGVIVVAAFVVAFFVVGSLLPEEPELGKDVSVSFSCGVSDKQVIEAPGSGWSFPSGPVSLDHFIDMPSDPDAMEADAGYHRELFAIARVENNSNQTVSVDSDSRLMIAGRVSIGDDAATYERATLTGEISNLTDEISPGASGEFRATFDFLDEATSGDVNSNDANDRLLFASDYDGRRACSGVDFQVV